MLEGEEKGHWESFDDIDGLGHECECLLEDRNGNIWIGTNSGLSRYDGKRFVTFTKRDGLADNSAQSLHHDRDGNIWIGTSNGLSRYDGREFVNFSVEDGLAGNYVYCIHQDREGNIWIGTSNGLSRYDGREFVNFSVKGGLAGNYVYCIHQDREGNIWIGTSGGLSRYNGEEFTNFTRENGLADNCILSVHQGKEGHVWIGTRRGLSRYDGEKFANFTHKDGLASDDVWCIHEDRDGNVWIGTLGSGVSCYNGNGFVNFNTKHGLAHNVVLDIMQDREGNLWFACYHGGISRYNPYEISHMFDEPVDEIMMQDRYGDLWWGLSNTLSHFDGEKLNHYPFKHTIFEIFEDSKGQFWIGTDGRGVIKYNSIEEMHSVFREEDIEDQKAHKLTVDDGLVNNRVTRIYEDSRGNMWIGTRGGLSRYDGMRFTNFRTDDGLGSNVISVILEDSSGKLWFGGWAGGGIAKYDGHSFRRYTKDDGLLDDRVVCIIEDDKGHLWIGTYAGLSRYDGKSFRNYTTEDGLTGSFIQRMIQDRRNHIWIATLGGGISRFDGRNFQVLTTEDGLPSNNVTGIVEDSQASGKLDQNGSSANTRDGSMIISTYRGICRYMPDYRTPPLIRIDEVDADRIYREPVDIQISQDISSIRIMYHGVSFKTKRMRYSYILEGYHKDWRATWDEEVRYENLPVGEYTFKVIAINKDLVCSEAPAELKVSVTGDPRDMVISELEERVRERTKELREAKDYIDNVVRSMADTLIVVNQDSVIQTVNHATLDLLGYREDELIGQPIEMIMAEEEPTRELGLYGLTGSDFVRNIEKIYIARDGRKIPVLFSDSIMRDDNGRIEGIVCVAQDITELKQAEERNRLFQQHLEMELDVARKIQRILLPQRIPSITGFSIGNFSQPAKQVGGDYHDLIQLPSGRIGIAIGDVSGKGMPASLLMANVQASLRRYSESAYSPREIIYRVNNSLCPICQYIEEHRFITLFYGVLDPEDKTMIYSNAGHNYPLIFRNNNGNPYEQLESTGLPCGIIEGASYEEAKIKLKPGDVALFYTDGITEATNPNDTMFGEARLIDVILSNLQLDPAGLVSNVRKELSNFVGNATQYDDLTLMVLKVQ